MPDEQHESELDKRLRSCHGALQHKSGANRRRPAYTRRPWLAGGAARWSLTNQMMTSARGST
jgi:hypothetical protein